MQRYIRSVVLPAKAAEILKKVNLLPYHNLGISKERNVGGVQEEFQPPSEEWLTKIENYFKKELYLDVSILGRV